MYLNKRIPIITLEAGYFIKVFTNKEATNLLSSVVKEVGDVRARKKWRENEETYSSVFSYLLSEIPLPNCFTTEQSTVKTSLFVLPKDSSNFPTYSDEFSNQALFFKQGKVAPAFCLSSSVL